MASEGELFEAIKDAVKTDGHLAKVQAELRARIIKIIHDGENIKLPEITPEVNLLNDLIREYLDWIGYQYTSSVLCTGEIRNCGVITHQAAELKSIKKIAN